MKMMYLPDVYVNWPWPRTLNRHYEDAKLESGNWFRSFHAFTPRSQYAFDKCDFPLLASLANPWASREHLRTACDLMNLFFMVDEYTDVESASSVRAIVDVVLDALHNPSKPRPKNEIVVGEVARQFWELGIKTASQTSQQNFLESFTAYLNSVIDQARDRDDNVFRTIDSYFETRRQNIGARPCYAMMELALHLPHDVTYHPVIAGLALCITDMIIVINDLSSYNKEQATGDDRHNILTIVMRQLDTDLDGAVRWVDEFHGELEKKFVKGLKTVPSWGPDIDGQVEEYVRGLANWARANDCWSFESGRYFGDKGLEIQTNRYVRLLPKDLSAEEVVSLHRDNVVIPLVEELERKAHATIAEVAQTVTLC